MTKWIIATFKDGNTYTSKHVNSMNIFEVVAAGNLVEIEYLTPKYDIVCPRCDQLTSQRWVSNCINGSITTY